jgi:SPP1 family predicted phage head-tail adaptor
MARGERRHVVTLEQPGDPVPDGLGGFTEEWTPLDPPTWYCAIQPAAARDMERLVAAGVVQTTAAHLLAGEYHPGITTETRLTFEGRSFRVQSVRDLDERHVALELVCTEAVA